MKPDTTGGCILILTLMATVLTRTWAGPVPRLPRILPHAQDCHLSQFKSLAPQELQAFKRAKDALEVMLLKKDVRCLSRLFPRAWELQQLQVWERPMALQAELTLTMNVLGNVTDLAPGDILDQPLHTLHHIHSQLQSCALAQPTAGPRPHSRRLSHWLHRLQEAVEKESPGCLQASVTFNLFRLLTRDLKCVSRGDLCV
ncbi:interferon lambda-2-like [Castor canadensis]|uniref:Interferon lambda-2-like n=2 Tax=Castor canadensis TaxID=51338 RepID=A0AC58LC48_CASCN|nr:interferon lambda-2-like [Castor canadensis]